MSGANSERRLTELGTGNWNNRGIDNHVKRPAGVSSAGLKRMGMKRIEGIESKVRESTVESSLKWPKQCLVDNEFVYDGLAVDHLPRSRSADPAFNAPAGIEASKTVHMHNHGALSEKERDGPEGGRSPAWLIGAQTKRRVPAPFQIHNPEPVKHEYLKPHNVKSRSMRRMGYENAASRQNWNMQKQQLNTGPLSHEGMSLDDWKQVSKKVHVNECGEIIFMAGGMEDLRPACTQALTKADKGASMVTNYLNDSRDLARFERRKTWAYTDEQWGRGNPQLAESPDMEHCMTGGPRTPSASAYDESCAPSEPRSFLQQRSPRSARPGDQSPSFRSYDQGSTDGRGGRGGPGGTRTPQSARASDRYERSSMRSYRSSVPSSCYSESDVGRRSKSQDRMSGTQSRFSDGGYSESRGGRRAKSQDRLSRTQGRYSDSASRYSDGASRYSDGSSVVTGVFSDPSRTVTAQALNEALQSARGPGRSGRSQRSPRKGR